MTFAECVPALMAGKEIKSIKLNKTLRLSSFLIDDGIKPETLTPLIPDTDDWEIVE